MNATGGQVSELGKRGQPGRPHSLTVSMPRCGWCLTPVPALFARAGIEMCAHCSGAHDSSTNQRLTMAQRLLAWTNFKSMRRRVK